MNLFCELPQNTVPQKIVIVRSLPGLGDLLCIVPALRALRSVLPQSEITLLGLPQAQGFVDRFGEYLDKWLEFPGFPGIPEVPFVGDRLATFLAHQHEFDIALQMHGNGSVMNHFLDLLKAKQRAGFYLPGQYCPDSRYFLPYPDGAEARRHLQLLAFLGIPDCGEALEFPLNDADRAAALALITAHGLHHYICLHPGASIDSRRWSTVEFAAVGDALAAQGYQIVLTGVSEEQDLTQTVAQSMQYEAIDLAGKTDLGTIAALLQQSRLLICNDTGISHLAAALQVKSVVIFSDSDPQRWAPLDRHRHRVVCRPDSMGKAQYCAATLTGAETIVSVLTEAAALLQPEYAHV